MNNNILECPSCKKKKVYGTLIKDDGQLLRCVVCGRAYSHAAPSILNQGIQAQPHT